jgi:hypothetical protein
MRDDYAHTTFPTLPSPSSSQRISSSVSEYVDHAQKERTDHEACQKDNQVLQNLELDSPISEPRLDVGIHPSVRVVCICLPVHDSELL